VAAQVDHVQRAVAEGDRVALGHQEVRRDGQRVRVVGVGDGVRAERAGHRAQGLPVVGVLVRGDDGAQRGPVGAGADQVGQAFRVVGGVDQQRFVAGAAHQQVGVVVHRADRDLGDGQPVQRAPGGRAARLDVTRVLVRDIHGRRP
jgi:hypothetical protein